MLTVEQKEATEYANKPGRFIVVSSGACGYSSWRGYWATTELVKLWIGKIVAECVTARDEP